MRTATRLTLRTRGPNKRGMGNNMKTVAIGLSTILVFGLLLNSIGTTAFWVLAAAVAYWMWRKDDETRRD